MHLLSFPYPTPSPSLFPLLFYPSLSSISTLPYLPISCLPFPSLSLPLSSLFLSPLYHILLFTPFRFLSFLFAHSSTLYTSYTVDYANTLIPYTICLFWSLYATLPDLIFPLLHSHPSSVSISLKFFYPIRFLPSRHYSLFFLTSGPLL